MAQCNGVRHADCNIRKDVEVNEGRGLSDDDRGTINDVR